MLYCVQVGVLMSRKFRQFAPEFKFNVVMQLLSGSKSITELEKEWRSRCGCSRGTSAFQPSRLTN